MDAGYLIVHFRARKHRGVEAAGGKFNPRQPNGFVLVAVEHHRGQIIAFSRIQQGVVGERAGGDNSRHVALHQALGLPRVFHLLANCHTQTQRYQLAQITFQLMVRKAGHGNGVFAFVAAGQRQAQQPGGSASVVEEQLVEISHPEQQQCVRASRLGFLILPHHRSVCHGEAW